TKNALEKQTPVLVLLRGDFGSSERAVDAVQAAGRFVAISLKEIGLHQIADPRWDFSRPIEHRAGIFIGTREWDVPSRNHLAALMIARRLSESTGESLTVFDYDGRRGGRLLSEIGFPAGKLRVLNKKLAYPDYLREIARHKIVLQLDTSFVPGQVAGDALLCRIPCVGGNGAIDRLGFPESCGHGRAIADLEQFAQTLLTRSDYYRTVTETMMPSATKVLGFGVVARQLASFF